MNVRGKGVAWRATVAERSAIMGFLGRYTETTYALLRIVAGFLFSLHGAQKVFGCFGGPGGDGQGVPLASQMGVAGLIELVCGVLILVGLLTAWAAFLASGEMAVAYFMAHAPQGFWPILNGGELAALYAFLFLFIAARGSGKLSLDGALGIGRKGGPA
jgi:putative oxidoreductase